MTFNFVFQAFLPQLIEAVEVEYDNDLITPAESARSSTTAFTPDTVLPTSSTDNAAFVNLNFIDDDDNDNVDETDNLSPTSADSDGQQSSSLNTPLFSFLTASTSLDASTSTTTTTTPPDPTLSSSVQSGALNVEVPPEIAANKDLTTVKYDLLIKLAEKFTNQKWL